MYFDIAERDVDATMFLNKAEVRYTTQLTSFSYDVIELKKHQ